VPATTRIVYVRDYSRSVVENRDSVTLNMARGWLEARLGKSPRALTGMAALPENVEARFGWSQGPRDRAPESPASFTFTPETRQSLPKQHRTTIPELLGAEPPGHRIFAKAARHWRVEGLAWHRTV
jgi:hypothetical protein